MSFARYCLIRFRHNRIKTNRPGINPTCLFSFNNKPAKGSGDIRCPWR